MPSENHPTPPPHFARGAKPSGSDTPVNPLHALFGALLLAVIGTAALAVETYGLPIVSAALCYTASAAVTLGALVVWADKHRRAAR